MINIAVIVLTYNRSDALRPVLESLAKQTHFGDEIVVADDGSREDHVRAIAGRHWNFNCVAKHVWHPDTGFTIASCRNLAVLHSSAPYLVFLDGDCVPAQDFLDQHRKLATPGCFVSGSRVLLSPNLTEAVIRGEEDLNAWDKIDWFLARVKGDVNKLTHLLRLPKAWRRFQKNFIWKGIRGCNLAAWRSDFFQIDGFDEAFNGWGHEDADFVLRLHRLGLRRINGYASTEVYHLWHKQSPRADEQKNRERVVKRMLSNQIRSELGLQARQLVMKESNSSMTISTDLF